MMSINFLNDFREILQREDAFGMDTLLADMEEWDSLSMMATMAYFDKKHATLLTFSVFKKTRTVADIAALIPGFVPEVDA